MALNFKVVITTRAVDNLYDIHNFIFRQSGDVNMADRITRRIVVYTDNLTFNPFMGRILSEYNLKTKDVRCITTLDKRYNIYYHVEEQARTVYIMKIVDGRQSIDRQLHGL